MTNQQIAEELLSVLGNSENHNPALALKEVLEKLRELMTGEDFTYEFGWMDCLKQIDEICSELEAL